MIWINNRGVHSTFQAWYNMENKVKAKVNVKVNPLIFGVVIIVVAFLPFIFIWSLNTLFPVVNIDYTWETWLASFVFLGFFRTVGVKS